MPARKTIEKARKDKREGKSPSTQAGEFVHEEIDKIRRGKHGARSTKQAIAIGLSEARRAGVDLPPPKKGEAKASTRKSAEYAYEVGQGERKPTRRPRVSRAVTEVLKREPKSTASRAALSRQAKSAASRRTAAERSAAAKKAAATKGAAARSAAARKAAATKGAAGRSAAARKAAATRGGASRATAARKPARTKSAAARSAGARKTARAKGAGGRKQTARKTAGTRTRKPAEKRTRRA